MTAHLFFHSMVHAVQELATAQPGHDASMAPQLDFTHPGVSYPLPPRHLQELYLRFLSSPLQV